MFITNGAGPFAESVLRADTTGDFRQRVGLMRQLYRCVDIPGVHPFNPLRDMVVQRAGPFADAVLSAGQAARRGLLRLIFLQRQIDLCKAGFAGRDVELIGLAARWRLCHLLDFTALHFRRNSAAVAVPRLRFPAGGL